MFRPVPPTRVAPRPATALRLVAGLRLAVVLGLAAALGPAGCAGGRGEDEGGGDLALPQAAAYFAKPCPEAAPAGRAGAGAVAGKDRELTYWSMWTKEEPQGKVLQHAFKCFEAKTGVKVTVEWLGRKYLTQNLAPALNTGKVPDLFDQDISQVQAAIVSAGGTQPVDDVLGRHTGEGSRTVADVVPDKFYNFAQNKDKNGKLVQIPYEILGSAWWYDKRRVKGFSAPATMEQLFALFDRAKREGRGAIAQDGDINLYNANFFSQLATRYVGPGGIVAAAADRTGRRWRTDPGFLRAAQYVERLARGRYMIDGWDASKFPQVQQRWADGEADYLFVGSWGPSETREYLTKQGSEPGGGGTIDYGSFQFPMPDGATHDIVERMPVGFAVTRQARHPEAAKAFMAYFLNRELLAGIPVVANNLTPRPDLPVPADIAPVKAALDDPRKTHSLFLDGLHGLFGGKYVDEVFYPADNDLLHGKITARRFIDTMARETADYWKAQG
jgi:raffinose/stachyose/melibiose transport system substrate-binding protein